MREVCRIFLPVDAELMGKIVEVLPEPVRSRAIIQTVTRGNEMRLLVPEGDDQIQGGVPSFPCHVPEWIAQWYCRGEIGRSAHALALYICPGDPPDCAPQDSDDVRRCVEFLKWAPLGEGPAIGRIVLRLMDEDGEWGRWGELRELVTSSSFSLELTSEGGDGAAAFAMSHPKEATDETE